MYAKGCEDLKTGPSSSSLFIPNSSQWRHETIDLSNLAGEQRVRFSIQFKSGWGNATYVDNINVKTLTNSINELENTIAFDIYPNPSDDMVNVTLEMKNGEHATIQIINSLGQIVLSNVIKNSHSSFNIAHLPTGVYYVKLQNDKGSAIKKVIKY